MPRGLILIRSEGDRTAVEKCLHKLQGSVDFVNNTNAIVESWCPCLGTADYAARVFAVSLEGLREASAYIRTELDNIESTAVRNTLTTTIAGSTQREVLDAFDYCRVLQKRKLLVLAEERNNGWKETFLATTIDMLVEDTLTTLAHTVRTMADKSGEHQPRLLQILEQLDKTVKMTELAQTRLK